MKTEGEEVRPQGLSEAWQDGLAEPPHQHQFVYASMTGKATCLHCGYEKRYRLEDGIPSWK